jgi:hypothetical protein
MTNVPVCRQLRLFGRSLKPWASEASSYQVFRLFVQILLREQPRVRRLDLEKPARRCPEDQVFRVDLRMYSLPTPAGSSRQIRTGGRGGPMLMSCFT